MTEKKWKIYLAAPYAMRFALRDTAKYLEGKGHTVTSRWLYNEDSNSTPDMKALEAEIDVEDVKAAEAVFHFAAVPPYRSGGGKFVEFGIGLGLGKAVIHIGPAESVFCHHHAVLLAADVDQALKALEACTPCCLGDTLLQTSGENPFDETAT